MKGLLTTVSLLTIVTLTACGGGGTTNGASGAPALSSKCSITNLSVSSGNSATLTKSSSQLSASLTLNLTAAQTVDITTDFENSVADDWIEGYPFIKSLSEGDHSVTLSYDLNSPAKNVTDQYTRLSVTVRLPGNEACVSSLPVNIVLNP